MNILLLAGAIALAPASPTLTAEQVLLRAAEQNPSISEARQIAAASRERATAAGSLPAPMLTAQTWNAPLARPWSSAEAEMTMYGVEQRIPFPTGLRAQRAEAGAAADQAGEAAAATRAAVLRDARVAFHDYWRASRELAIHGDHLDLAREVLALAETRYATGAGRQHDVLRARLAVSREHASVYTAGASVATAQAVLAALLSMAEVELLPPSLPEDAPGVPALAPLLVTLESRRPEVRAADDAVRGARAGRTRALSSAWLPDVTVGATWMDANMGEDGGMAMVALDLPWVWSGRRAEARAAARELSARESARRATSNGARAELSDAHARASAARDVLALHRRDLLPNAERTTEAVRAAWVAGDASLTDLLDSLEQRLLARVEADRARARLESALADLDRAAGVDPLLALPTSAGER